MWPLAQERLEGPSPPRSTRSPSAVRLLAERNPVVAESAGAASVAVALSGRVPGERVACIVSGGNIGLDVLSKILSPEAEHGDS